MYGCIIYQWPSPAYHITSHCSIVGGGEHPRSVILALARGRGCSEAFKFHPFPVKQIVKIHATEA